MDVKFKFGPAIAIASYCVTQRSAAFNAFFDLANIVASLVHITSSD